MKGRFTRARAVLAAVVTGVLITVLAFGALGAKPATPAAAAPTFPGGTTRVAAAPQIMTLFSSVITQNTQGPAVDISAFDRIDVQYVIAMSGTNTTTIKLLHSNNSSNWVTGATVGSSVLTNSTDMTATFNFGARTAISVVVSNTNPVTLTVLALAK